MSKIISAYYRVKSEEEALSLLAQPDTKLIGGGAHLLSRDVNCAVIDLQDLGLAQIKQQENTLVAGAMTRLASLESTLAETADETAVLLTNVLHKAGPNTYRNAATVGGTIARRLTDSEWLAALLVLNASLTLRGPDPAPLSVQDYLAASERPFGLITHLTIPWGEGTGSTHRVARTPADYPIVSVTGWQPADGTVRLAATGIGERPWRLTDAETAVGTTLSESSIANAAGAAAAANQHPGDFRGDAAYRADMAAVLTRRVLNDLL